jgi:sodium/hydrogen antiporter
LVWCSDSESLRWWLWHGVARSSPPNRACSRWDRSPSPSWSALLVFGALITPERLSHLGWQGWLLAVLAIVVVRPVSLLLSLLRTEMPRRERLTAAWFGPKGFAAVVYGLLVLQSGIPDNELVFDLVAVTIALSIVLHSSTDVPVARMLRVEPPDNLPAGRRDADEPSISEHPSPENV